MTRYSILGGTFHKQALDFGYSGTALKGDDCMAFWGIILELLGGWALPGRMSHVAN